jgi:hypothetical protein
LSWITACWITTIHELPAALSLLNVDS